MTKNYQTIMQDTLNSFVSSDAFKDTVRSIVREEIGSTVQPPKKGNGNNKVVEEKVSLKQTLYSTNIKDYEPKKVNGNYKWGKKGDTVKSRNYRAMMTAYCYAVATKGKALACYDSKGNKVCDFDEVKGAYEKAKAAFQKAYPYVKMADRK